MSTMRLHKRSAMAGATVYIGPQWIVDEAAHVSSDCDRTRDTPAVVSIDPNASPAECSTTYWPDLKTILMQDSKKEHGTGTLKPTVS